ncbi:prolipoprotein diacylglyceryl transferase [Desulforudis sp. 1088]|uniref:prolipoprotein diacylglyceryl transferase n=1 Tax=unclassified Candidatus Desulforudis TaxID=2635950 RepID=UPI003493E9EA
MQPILFYIGPLPVHGYGLMLAIGVAVGTWVVAREGRRLGWNVDTLLDLAIYLIIAGVAGSRLLYLLIEPQEIRSPLDVLRVWEGGLSFYGALGLCLVVFIWFARRRRLPVYGLGDLLALGVAAGYPFGRIGCFLNGCCYGRPTDLPWAVTFPFDHIARHPTQLYSAGFGLAIFLTLWFLRKRKPFDGYLMWLYLFLYAAYRFIIDFWRESPPGVEWLTVGQLGSLAVMLVALIALRLLSRKARITN